MKYPTLKTVLIPLLCILSIQYLNAQYIFRHLDIIDGLSDNQIRSLSMMPDGRIGVKTASILNIYNGATFKQCYQDKWKEYQWNNYKTPKEYYDSEGRMWMKERDYLLLLDLNTNQFIYNIDEILKSYGVNQRLINLFIDDSKNYWFVTEDNTVLFYDIHSKTLINITGGNSNFTREHGIPREITQYKNFYWIIYSDGTICCWDYTSKEFVSQDDSFSYTIDNLADHVYINTTDKERVYMHTTETGNLWLMFTHGIYRYDRITQQWTTVTTISGFSNFFTCLDLDSKGNVWVGTSRSGLRFINGETLEVETIPGLKIDNGGTIYNDIFSVFVDNKDGVWVGTLFQGLCYYHPSMKKFRLHHVVNNENIFTNEVVYSFLEEDNGSIMIGTGIGLFRYNPLNGFTEQIYKKEIGENLCTSLYQDSHGRIWVSTFFNGFFCIDKGKVTSYKNHALDLNSFPNPNNAQAIYEDKKGNFWVSVMGGVGKFDTKTGKVDFLLKKHPKLKAHTFNYSFYTIDDNTFATIGENGVFYYNIQNDSVWIPAIDNPDNLKFKDKGIKYYFRHKDSRGLEWFGTENGIRVWDNTNNRRYVIDITKGLPDNSALAILEDQNGILWISTVGGISKIETLKNKDEYEFSIVNFNSLDGLQAGKFSRGGALKTLSGDFYFGGVHGFNSFNPEKIVFNQSQNRPIITSFYLSNSLIKEGEEYNNRVVLERSIDKTTEIELNYNENFITLEFSGLNYVNPSQTYYKYKLENFDSEWNEVLSNGLGKATYTGLQPGNYKFIVYTANNDKIWSDEATELLIIIKPPFWKTNYAIIVYLLLTIGLIVWLFVFVERKNKKKLAEQQLVNERKQKDELEQMKYRFFTNISHEFRTPLSLIIMPLESLIKKETDDVKKSKFTSIYNNAKNLLNLVNQLLDFRKLEIQGEKLKLTFVNIPSLLQGIYMQFKDSVEEKGINFVLDLQFDLSTIYIDEGKIHKIMNNLLSNALKHTPPKGNIKIAAGSFDQEDNSFLKISVSNTGKSIPEEDKKRIFDRFYQGQEQKNEWVGTGIGLHLVKEYVNLHQGSILVENLKDGGVVFSLLIPTILQGDNADISSSVNTSSHDNQKKTLLLVEDNSEFRTFLVEQLSPAFNILEAVNGEEGEDIAILKMPDLIISDIMMPKVDGITLCIRLKKNIQTSHIPFILLTARNSDEAKIEGYEAGADSYISKPFNIEILLTRIKKLIEQQNNRKELFHKSIEVSPSNITITSLDEELVKKALQCVEENMDNITYSVEDLSKDVALSRVHLYRKLQSITGQTPVEFIRSIRLKRAAQYLLKSQYNISEIADMVGFNTLKYFNKHFKDEFGMTPSQYRTEKKE